MLQGGQHWRNGAPARDAQEQASSAESAHERQRPVKPQFLAGWWGGAATASARLHPRQAKHRRGHAAGAAQAAGRQVVARRRWQHFHWKRREPVGEFGRVGAGDRHLGAAHPVAPLADAARPAAHSPQGVHPVIGQHHPCRPGNSQRELLGSTETSKQHLGEHQQHRQLVIFLGIYAIWLCLHMNFTHDFRNPQKWGDWGC